MDFFWPLTHSKKDLFNSQSLSTSRQSLGSYILNSLYTTHSSLISQTSSYRQSTTTILDNDMASRRPPLQPISGNKQKMQKTQSFEERVRQFFQTSYNTLVSDLLTELDHPFIIPIELYLSAREPTVSLEGLDYIRHDPYDVKINFYIATFFDPVGEDIAALIQSSLADTSVVDVSFDWAFVGGMEVMPTVYIEVPPETVTDWADLESGIRGVLARNASRMGIVIDVQFRVKDARDVTIGMDQM